MDIGRARQLHRDTFREVFQLPRVHEFGHGAGVDDDNDGVQWNAGVDAIGNDRFRGWVGVNLEGKEYDGWPIARLIKRELDSLVLFRLMANVGRPEEITVRWSRDAWGPGGSRLALQENQIPSARLSELTEDRDRWRDKLAEAQGCLRSKEGGRGRQEVTVGNTRAPQWASPHLQFSRELWRGELPSEAVRVRQMQDARKDLLPLYRAIADLSETAEVAEARREIESLEAEETYEEGESSRVLVKHFERSPALRAKAIEIHGTSCQGCRFSFAQVYGDHGAGYIEVHHLKPLASYAGAAKVDPRADLAVLCSNCHRMVHRHPGSPLSVDELRKILRT